MPEPVFVDTWGWTALGYRRDTRHQDVKAFYQRLRRRGARIYTSDYILDELATLLFRREVFDEAVHFMEGILEAAEKGFLGLERITPERFTAAWRLRRRYKDKPQISFTDFTSMIVMEELGLREILTEDDHFLQVGMSFKKVP